MFLQRYHFLAARRLVWKLLLQEADTIASILK